MGWQDRDWARSEQQPELSLLRRYRAGVWLAGAALALMAIIVIGPHLRSRGVARSTSGSWWGLTTPGLPKPWATPKVMYGWRVAPPSVNETISPSFLAAYPGYTPLCTTRQRTATGWSCMDLAFVAPGHSYVIMPASSPDSAAPCSQLVAPGGKPFPCPGGWSS